MKLIFICILVITLIAEISGFNGYGYLTNRFGLFQNPNTFYNNYMDPFQSFTSDLQNNKISAYAYSTTNANSNNKAQAKSSLTFKDKSIWNLRAAPFPTGFSSLYDSYNVRNKWTPMEPYSFGNDGNKYNIPRAWATARFTPQMFQQTTGVASPYVYTPSRNFIGKPTMTNNYGVFTSTQSVSSHVNGKPVTYQQSSTTVNDNGKIKTHTIRYP